MQIKWEYKGLTLSYSKNEIISVLREHAQRHLSCDPLILEVIDDTIPDDGSVKILRSDRLQKIFSQARA
jgi:hypothetical protein